MVQVENLKELKNDFDIFYTKKFKFYFYNQINKHDLMNHREITKKYSELLNKAEVATGRKEVVGLLKKAAKLKSQIEIQYYIQKLV